VPRTGQQRKSTKDLRSTEAVQFLRALVRISACVEFVAPLHAQHAHTHTRGLPQSIRDASVRNRALVLLVERAYMGAFDGIFLA
jgi:hypothetical protein